MNQDTWNNSATTTTNQNDSTRTTPSPRKSSSSGRERLFCAKIVSTPVLRSQRNLRNIVLPSPHLTNDTTERLFEDDDMKLLNEAFHNLSVETKNSNNQINNNNNNNSQINNNNHNNTNDQHRKRNSVREFGTPGEMSKTASSPTNFFGRIETTILVPKFNEQRMVKRSCRLAGNKNESRMNP